MTPEEIEKLPKEDRRKYEQLHVAKLLATRWHAGQFRRDGFTPYTVHLSRVAQRVSGDVDACIVAWLHDIVEDTSVTLEELRCAEGGGFPDLVLEAVDLLTKKEGVTYEDYLAAIKQHPLACKVKISDMLDNLSDNPTRKQIIKYTKGLLYLHDESPQLVTDCPVCSSQANLNKALTIARELLAAIRVNALRGTFANCTQEQIDDFLAPRHEALKDL